MNKRIKNKLDKLLNKEVVIQVFNKKYGYCIGCWGTLQKQKDFYMLSNINPLVNTLCTVGIWFAEDSVSNIHEDTIWLKVNK